MAKDSEGDGDSREAIRGEEEPGRRWRRRSAREMWRLGGAEGRGGRGWGGGDVGRAGGEVFRRRRRRYKATATAADPRSGQESGEEEE